MKLLELYNLQKAGEITQEEFASSLGLSLTNLRIRVTKWGSDLPKLLSVLDRIAGDELERADAARLLKCSPRQVNHLMRSWQVVRPLKQYLIDRKRAEVKWEIRKKLAIDYIAGSKEIEDAAAEAEVSERQMRRWVSELLMKHFEMPWKDLKHVSGHRRLRLAQEIETAEGIELQKKRLVEDIVAGKKGLVDEAVDRAIDKTTRLSRRKAVKSPVSSSK